MAGRLPKRLLPAAQASHATLLLTPAPPTHGPRPLLSRSDLGAKLGEVSEMDPPN
jgi:hypothetical protein